MDEFEKRKRKILQPIFFEAGAALHDCQSFEYSISYLLYLFSRFGTDNLDVNSTVAILEHEERKTAGQLVSLLNKHLKVSDEIEESLKISLEARNTIIHRYLIENVERLVDINEHDKIIAEIKSLRNVIQRSIKLLDPFIKTLSEMIDNFSIDDFHKESKDKFMKDTNEQ